MKNAKKIKIEKNGNCKAKSEISSIDEGKEMFEWIINPIKSSDFMREYWEKKPNLINRSDKNYYNSLMSMKSLNNMIRENYLEYTKNIDITSYRDGIRETHNPEGNI